ncbi:LysM domain-containing protein [Humibacter sp.]|uniref:LysM domain-containing protein n=1 Tax=Humibacter sp. TaxID=1940291 RepID=UPI002B5A9363|nr:LysM domain-containing protein [Humibacter sp.]HVX08469.1 LysM domain-containing protein [Humibacter sp.]
MAPLTVSPRSRRMGRVVAAMGVAALVTATLAGCFALGGTATAHAAHKQSHHSAAPTKRPTASATPDPALSHPATAEPAATPEPSPTITPVPAGTVVAEADVASPKGSIHFHYRMVANGDNTYSAQYSGFTSTVPVPVSVTLIDVPPSVGDGLTYHGVGDHLLGGPTTSPQSSSVSLGSETEPSYLGTLVTYSSVASGDDVPVELGPNKVLAVNTISWHIPARQTNVHPVDGGARTFATGSVTETTAGGAPKSYLIAPGDLTAVVAQRFGISVADLIWLNAGLEVFGDQQYLYEGTKLNLDPNSI